MEDGLVEDELVEDELVEDGLVEDEIPYVAGDDVVQMSESKTGTGREDEHGAGGTRCLDTKNLIELLFP